MDGMCFLCRMQIRFLIYCWVLLGSQLAFAKENEAASVAKKVSQLPMFWELIGGFVAVFVIGVSLVKMIEFWLKKAGYLRDDTQDRIERLTQDVRVLYEAVDKHNRQVQPFVDVLTPSGISLERTKLYHASEVLTSGVITKIPDIVDLLKEQKRQNRQIIAVIRYIASKRDEDVSAGALDIFFEKEE